MKRKKTEPYVRLTQPLVRDSGVLRPASWDEALDRAAAGFRRTLESKGPEAFGMFSCARATNEMNYIAQKFTRAVIGTNNVDSCNRTCHAPSVAGLARVFDSGGGTSSYQEIEDADVVVIWGGNPREAHPIFFQHVLKAVHRGAKLFVVDPRRTSTARWAHRQLQLEVGTDIPLAHAIAREIIHSGLANETFISRATTGFEEFAASVEPWTLEAASKTTGVPAELIRELAHTYARADRGQLSWTLGITEHHNGTDNVLSLINLALLAGQVGRYGAGLNPLRGQNNVQGGGDMGAIPDRLPGFQDVLSPEVRAKFDDAWGSSIPPHKGLNLTQMLDAMERGALTCVYIIGENPVQSEADCEHTIKRLSNVDHLVVQDIFLTKTAQLADVVLPASAAWCESDGTFTNSERRVQRVRRALEPPSGARDDIELLSELARRLGHDWHYTGGEDVWDELRSLSPMHAGMSYQRLEELGGIQWPCYSEDSLEPTFLHGRLWAEDPDERGRLAPFTVIEHSPPVDLLTEEFPIRLTTGRRLDSYNTGVQSGGFPSPLRQGETLDLCPEDARSLGVVPDELVQISSRRGAIVAPVRIDDGLRPGLAFMTFHFPDEVDVNVITIEATCPVAGTAEYKAAAIRVDKLVVGGSRGGLPPGWGLGLGPRRHGVIVDLKFLDAVATPEEKAAVESFVGGDRDQLLPALHAVNDRVGWISQGALNLVCEALQVPPAEAYGVASFYSLFALDERPPRVMHVCTDLACRINGSDTVCDVLTEHIGAAGKARGGVTWERSPCLGVCEKAPAALMFQAGDPAVTELLAPVTGSAAVLAAGRAPSTEEGVPPVVHQKSGRRLLRRVGVVDPSSVDGYRASDGFSALRNALRMGPAAVIREVSDSGLMGRGGAAFPTGRKWSATAGQPVRPHYLVCNADESEPGTFKDRVLIEGDPFALVESMTIAAYAIGASRGYIYLRGEYPRALRLLRNALDVCRERGFLGMDIMGHQGFSFDIEIRRGAGAYICGEETAIFNSIEGFRGEPRTKPPFPVESGLFGKPTVVNNVETLMNVPLILTEGAAAYRTIGTEKSTGPKLFCLSGNVQRPGVYEVPFGATLRELLELAGGVPEGRSLRAVLLGGAAGGFVRADEIDLPLTMEDARAAGTTLGSGVVLVLDDLADLGGFLLRIASFFRDESCGQCVPCRIGTVRQEEAVRRVVAAGSDERGLLREVGQVMRDSSICGLGQTAWNAIESAIDRLGALK